MIWEVWAFSRIISSGVPLNNLRVIFFLLINADIRPRNIDSYTLGEITIHVIAAGCVNVLRVVGIYVLGSTDITCMDVRF